MRRVVVTGVDCLTSLGSTEATWQGILDNRHAYQPLPERIARIGVFRTRQVSFIGGGYAPEPEVAEIRADRFVHLTASCAIRALRDARLEPRHVEADRFGVIAGSANGAATVTETQLAQLYEFNNRKVHPASVPMATLNSISGQIAILLGARGVNLTVSTACSSGNQSICLGYDAVALNRADVVVAGAGESPTSPLLFAGFDNLRVMAPAETGGHPFSRDRGGFVLGEGAGVVILEELEHALARNARIYGEIAGYSMSCDAHHMVIPYPQGDIVENTMRQALEMADMSIRDIDYINAHGTATMAGDVAETEGIRRLFGPLAANIPVSSVKGAVGHTLGASGAIEAVICMLAMRDRIVPPTVNFSEPDPELPLDFVPYAGKKCDIAGILSNSFGFGGNNSTIAFKRFTA